jgi:hypothetical protein
LAGVAALSLTAAGLLAWSQFHPPGRSKEATKSSPEPASFAGANVRALLTFGLDMSSFAVRGKFSDRRGKPYTIGQLKGTKPVGECIAVVGPGGDVGSTCGQPRLFSQGPVIWLEGFEGGPAPSDRSSEYIAGIAAPPVKRIDVVDSSGATQTASLGGGNAFFFTVDPEDLGRGVFVDHLDAVGANGEVVSRIAVNDGS